MAKFRTEVIVPPSLNRISHRSKILFIGSCFTENIGARLEEYKFNVDINPFGIVYNPASVQQNLEALIERKKYSEKDLRQINNLWISFDHHGRFSDPDEVKTLQKINERITYSSSRLQQTEYLIITFGTAWIYRLVDSGKVVSNCHKFPSKYFTRELLNVKDITQSYNTLIQKLQDTIPGLKIIFTVSPVRHWKDGPIQNTISKATLVLAIMDLTMKYSSVEYFPAFEIAIDDLRDYRFYADDMLHPNNQMTNYIWEKFSDTYFDSETIQAIEKIRKLLSALQHRPFFPGSDQHNAFIRKQKEYLGTLKEEYPWIDFTEENKLLS